VVCIGGTILSTIYYLAAVPLVPSLVGNHPVLLEALGGTQPAMAAAGAFARAGRVSLLSAIVAPLAGLGAGAPFFWWAGRRYGNALTTFAERRNPRAKQEVERALRMYRRHGGWTLVFASYLPVPNPVLYATTGWSGFGFPQFAVLSLIGTMLRIVPAVALGYALGDPAVRLAVLLSRYSIAATLALSSGVIAVIWWRHGHRSRSGGGGEPASPTRSPAG
jgi:membrane protein DedA with SNARE-associated domain